MDNLSKKMTEIIVGFDNLICDVRPYINGFLRKEKEQELETIEKEINSFSPSNKPIPEKLHEQIRALQADLNEIEDVQKNYSKFLFLVKVLVKEMTLDNEQKTKNKTSEGNFYQASLHPAFMKNLVIKGVLRPGTEIERNCNGKSYKGKILPDGKISV